MPRPRGRVTVLIGVILAACAGEAPPPATTSTTRTESFWAVDLVRTLPGAQDDYLASIRANWSNARRIAKARGTVISYRALATQPDSVRGWDVLLMTEYADSASWQDREEIFRAIFESPEFVAVAPARPSDAMRTFEAGDVMLREVISDR